LGEIRGNKGHYQVDKDKVKVFPLGEFKENAAFPVFRRGQTFQGDYRAY